MLRIGIACYPVYGGSGAVATELGLALAQRGHEVHFISYAQPFRLPYFVERVFYHEVELPSHPLFEHPPYSLALAAAMHSTAVRRDLDIIHAHYAVPHATSAWIARQMLGDTRTRVVATLHGTDITLIGQDPSFKEITRFSIEHADGVTAVSRYLRDETVRVFGIAPERIRVIPNFVDLDRYNRDRQPCHRSSFVADGEKIVMHISNFRPVKRVDLVVRVFARILREVPARLILVGDGPERGRALQAAEEEGVQGSVLFLGKQESVAELLACADLFLLPSESESFGLVALEAMACGVPVVASDVGGLPEVVPVGTAGVLAPVGDVETMARAGVDFLSDAERWRAASRAARAAATRFDADEVVPLYEAYYQEVLDT